MKFSIITICYNEPKLSRTCQSIINQTFQDFEWIVIDGGSNKETLEIFEKYKDRIDHFISEPDKGRYNAMNKGIKLAQGEYLNFMNAGDMFVKDNVLEKVLLKMKSNSDVYYGDGYFEYNDGKIEEHICEQDLNYKNLYMKALLHQSMFFNRELFEKFGGYDEKYEIVSDWAYYLKLLKNECSFEHVNIFVAKDDKLGISTNNANLVIIETRNILKKLGVSDDEIKDLENKKRSQFLKNHIFKNLRERVKKYE